MSKPLSPRKKAILIAATGGSLRALLAAMILANLKVLKTGGKKYLH